MVRVELKYCEQCGGLLLRRAGDNVVFCAPCQKREQEMPPTRPTARKWQREKPERVLAPGIQGVAIVAGRASA